jgi:hypothetical protein
MARAALPDGPGCAACLVSRRQELPRGTASLGECLKHPAQEGTFMIWVHCPLI